MLKIVFVSLLVFGYSSAIIGGLKLDDLLKNLLVLDLGKLIGGLVGTVGALLGGVLKLITGILGDIGLGNLIGNLIGGVVPNLVKGLVTTLDGLTNTLLENVKSLLSGLGLGGLNPLIGTVQKIVRSVLGLLGNLATDINKHVKIITRILDKNDDNKFMTQFAPEMKIIEQDAEMMIVAGVKELTDLKSAIDMIKEKENVKDAEQALVELVEDYNKVHHEFAIKLSSVERKLNDMEKKIRENAKNASGKAKNAYDEADQRVKELIDNVENVLEQFPYMDRRKK